MLSKLKAMTPPSPAWRIASWARARRSLVRRPQSSPFSPFLAIEPQDAVACGRLYFIGQSSRSFFGRPARKWASPGAKAKSISVRRGPHQRDFRGPDRGIFHAPQKLIGLWCNSTFAAETDTMIAVVGATGNTGRAVVKELKALGHDPVCIVRNAQKAQEVLGPDAKTAVAELTDRPALEKALKGVTSVFVVTGHNPQMVE